MAAIKANKTQAAVTIARASVYFMSYKLSNVSDFFLIRKLKIRETIDAHKKGSNDE